jgi:hypothetical protein
VSTDDMPQSADEKVKQPDQERPDKQPQEGKPITPQTVRASPRPPLFRR